MPVKRKGETSYKETSFGIIPRSKLIPLEIEGTKRAWDFILSKTNKSPMPVSSIGIKQIHKIAFGWIFPKMGGRFRKTEVEVSKHMPPKFYLVPQLIEDMCRDINKRIKHLPPIDDDNFINELTGFLAWAHHRFLWIHPFLDYNGRIGRLLMNILLLNLKLPPIELKAETKTGRKKYIDALKRADDGNHRDLEKIIQAALQETGENP
ncbi:Fic family protein [Patescibacteria group bacterium]|nr:Fic family protein [Patescibacteria group bacterium]